MGAGIKTREEKQHESVEERLMEKTLEKADDARYERKWQSALHLYDEVLKMNPSKVKALSGKALVFFELGQYQDSIYLLSRAISLQPKGDYTLWNNAAEVLLKLGRKSEAEHYYRQAILLNPKDPNVWFNLGVVLNQLGRIDEAKEAYDVAAFIPRREYDELWANH